MHDPHTLQILLFIPVYGIYYLHTLYCIQVMRDKQKIEEEEEKTNEDEQN